MKILNRLKFILPIVGAVFVQELKGQSQWWPEPGAPYPEGRIYPFATVGDIEEYDTLKTESERREYIQKEFNRDWFDEIIPYSYDSFACGSYSLNVQLHFTKLEKGTMYGESGRVIFDGYDGMELDSIYKHHGTWQGIGNGILPLLSLELFGPEIKEAHARLISYPGKNLFQESMCIEEPQTDETGLQPAEGSNVMPLNLEQFNVGYPYTYIDADGRTHWSAILLAKYTIKNGKITLLESNPQAITERDSIAPTIEFTKNADNTLNYKIKDKNFKKGTATIDNKIEITITDTTGTIDLDTLKLPNGTYKIKFTATDYAKQTGSDSTYIQITKTGIVDNKNLEGIIISPNPVRDYLNIVLNTGSIDNVFVKIYSLDGKKCEDQLVSMQNNIGKIDLTRLKPSVYIMQSIMGDKLYTNKIVKSE